MTDRILIDQAKWVPGAALVAFSLGATLVATRFFLRVAPRWGLMDLPNARSAHRIPTPRGGGLPLMLVVGFSLFATRSLWAGSAGGAVALGGALGLGLMGLADDRMGLTPLTRLLVQSLAAAALVWSTGGLVRLPLPAPLDLAAGRWGGMAAFVWVVAVVNFYNFLDGIDGLAGLQGAVTALGVALAAWDPLASLMGAAVAGACLGFLAFNWHPARLFLGDVGSNLLGYTFAAVPFLAEPESRGAAVFFVGTSLWFFLADASWTLLRRLGRGERFTQAHRQHLYQRLVDSGCSQGRVAAAIGVGSILVTALALVAWKAEAAVWGWATLAAAVCLFLIELWTVRGRERGRALGVAGA